MNKKGFTLIELLAVIVILAIIALIATPIILGIINDTRKSASEQGAELIVKNVETAYSTAYMTNGGIFPTAEQVYAKFKMDKASIDTTTGKITPKDTGINCETTTENDILKVVCTANDKTFGDDSEVVMNLATTTVTPETPSGD